MKGGSEPESIASTAIKTARFEVRFDALWQTSRCTLMNFVDKPIIDTPESIFKNVIQFFALTIFTPFFTARVE